MSGRDFDTGFRTLLWILTGPQKILKRLVSEEPEALRSWDIICITVHQETMFQSTGRPTAGARRLGVSMTARLMTIRMLNFTSERLFDAVARAHKDNGLIMDFAMGPNQGQGVPAPDDSDGLMWDLHAYNISVPIGGSFSGQLPGWGSGKLQAAITGLAISSVNASGLAPSLPNNVVSNRTQITLSTESLQDITSQVSPDGRVSIQFSSDKPGIEYTIFAVYLVKMHYRNEADPTTLNGPHTVPQDIVHNGSWAVDHFSPLGAKIMTDFWEKYLLVNGTKELLMEVGNYAWEDSVEIPPNLYWTRYLPDVFEKNRGYSINKWLPILFHQNVLGFYPSPNTWWITDEVDAGNGHIGDYRTTVRL